MTEKEQQEFFEEIWKLIVDKFNITDKSCAPETSSFFQRMGTALLEKAYDAKRINEEKN